MAINHFYNWKWKSKTKEQQRYTISKPNFQRGYFSAEKLTEMSCRSVSWWPPLPTLKEKRSNFAPISFPHWKLSKQTPKYGRKLASNRKSHHHFARNCLNNGNRDFSQQDQPQDALLKAISGMYSNLKPTQVAGIIVAWLFCNAIFRVIWDT